MLHVCVKRFDVMGGRGNILGWNEEVNKAYMHVYTKVSYVWVIPSCGDDAVNRTIVRVVVTIVHVFGDACRASRLFYCFHA
jgi:hypothetical protein